MHTAVKLFLLLGLVLPAHFSYATQSNTIKAAVPSSMPPYIIETTKSGIALDIISKIYRNNGYKIDFSFLPNHRVAKEFLDKKHALAFSIPYDSSNQKIFYSKAILSFKNVVVSLAVNNFQIASLSDLKNLSITAFQNATNFLGDKFKELAQENRYYKEITNQQQQLTLLLKGRTDVIIMEERIFLYHLKKLKSSNAVKQQFKIHAIFKPSKRYCAFHDIQQRDMFNRGLESIKKSADYQAIIDKYITVLKP